MHLVDHARRRIEESYRRPLAERLMRRMLGAVLTRPLLFRLALHGALLARPLTRLMPRRLRPLLALAPRAVPRRSATERAQIFPARGERRMRVALLPGCAQLVLAPQINEATIRLLTRHGCEVVVAAGAGCCGGLTHHMGRPSLGFVKANVDAWTRAMEEGGLDAIVVNTSGCGVTIRDYGYLLREDAAYREKAARISALTKDLSEFFTEIGLGPATGATGRRVAYHSACSLQHGLGIREQPKALLAKAGFTVLDVPEAHLCCGSAGTYNMLQPEIAERLRERKQRNIESTGAELVAAGNVGCITQLARGGLPVLHTVELLDWATGGPMPAVLRGGETPASAR
jgi:glycolate oxidase iron-sulfur subunit